MIGLIGAVAALGVVLWQQRGTDAGVPSSRDAHCRHVPFATLLGRQWLPLGLVLLLAGLCFWSGLFSQYDPQHPSYGLRVFLA